MGPDSLRHVKRTYKEALKRQIMVGNYNPEDPVIVPVKKDYRYRMWKNVKKPENNAVIIYMMDVSGSMGDEQKEIVRTESFWIDTWLRSQYNDIDIRYIIHDASAREVDQDTFYHTRESGGTLISSAYKLCNEIIDKEYPVSEWNIYSLHFSDGDNWSGEDTKLCVELLKEQLLPKSNLFCYGQVESRYGSGQFIKDLMENFQGRRAAYYLEDRESKKRSIVRSRNSWERANETGTATRASESACRNSGNRPQLRDGLLRNRSSSSLITTRSTRLPRLAAFRPVILTGVSGWSTIT